MEDFYEKEKVNHKQEQKVNKLTTVSDFLNLELKKVSKLKTSVFEQKITNFGVHNISSLQLNYLQTKVLGYGLKFIPTPELTSNEQLTQNINKFKRTLRMKEFFKNKDLVQVRMNNYNKLTLPNPKFQPPIVNNKLEKKLELFEQFVLKINSKTNHFNWSKVEKQTLFNLKNNNSIILRPADKNLGIVVCDRQWYVNEVNQTLSNTFNYQQVSNLKVEATKKSIDFKNKQVFAPRVKQNISNKASEFIKQHISFENIQVGHFYLTIKVHKNKPCGRPILPSHSWPTSSLSIVVDSLLQKVVKSIDSITTNSIDFINKIEKTPFHNKHLFLVTGDVESLYPNIPIDEGLERTHTVLNKLQTFDKNTNLLIKDMMSAVLKNSFLQFNNKYYQQINGTAMGTPMAPTYANIFMFSLEEQLREQRNNKYFPNFYQRYIDDIFLIWENSLTELHLFCLEFNNLNSSIKVNWNISQHNMNFLDLKIVKGVKFDTYGILDTKMFQKSMNLFLYLPFNSFHPIENKIGFITGELKRFIRSNSDIKDYISDRNKFFWRLKARGYPHKFLVDTFNKISYSQRLELLHPNKNTELNKIIFVTDYNNRIRPSQWRTMFKIFFEEHVTLALRKTENFQDILCPAKLKQLGTKRKREQDNNDIDTCQNQKRVKTPLSSS